MVLEDNMDVVKRIMSDNVLFKASMSDTEIQQFEAGTWEPEPGQYLNYDDKAIIKLDPLSNCAVCIHVYLQSQYWGEGISSKLEHEIEKWLIDNTSYGKVVLMTPQCCREVLKVAVREGYALEGILTAAILWRDNVENLILMSKFLKRTS